MKSAFVIHLGCVGGTAAHDSGFEQFYSFIISTLPNPLESLLDPLLFCRYIYKVFTYILHTIFFFVVLSDYTHPLGLSAFTVYILIHIYC